MKHNKFKEIVAKVSEKKNVVQKKSEKNSLPKQKQAKLVATEKKSSAKRKSMTKSTAHEEEKVLTPWQQANLKYLKEKGNKPKWIPDVIENPDLEKKENFEDQQQKLFDDQEHSDEESAKEQQQKEFSNVSLQPVPEMEKMKTTPTPSKRLVRRSTILITIFSIIALIILYQISPWSKLRGVIVSGNNQVKTTNIVAASKLKKEESLWKQYFNKKEIVTDIKKANPRVKSATVSIKSINKIQITVKERETVAYMLSKGKYYTILDNAQILKEKPVQPEGNLPILSGFKNQKVLKSFLTAYTKVPAGIQGSISEIHSTPTQHNPYLLTLYMNDGNQVIISTKEFADKITYYPDIAAQMDKKGVIDMEVGAYSYDYENSAAETDLSNENSTGLSTDQEVKEDEKNPENANNSPEANQDDGVSEENQ